MRARFTIAHELGHTCLHWGFPRPRLAPEAITPMILRPKDASKKSKINSAAAFSDAASSSEQDRRTAKIDLCRVMTRLPRIGCTTLGPRRQFDRYRCASGSASTDRCVAVIRCCIDTPPPHPPKARMPKNPELTPKANSPFSMSSMRTTRSARIRRVRRPRWSAGSTARNRCARLHPGTGCGDFREVPAMRAAGDQADRAGRREEEVGRRPELRQKNGGLLARRFCLDERSFVAHPSRRRACSSSG